MILMIFAAIDNTSLTTSSMPQSAALAVADADIFGMTAAAGCELTAVMKARLENSVGAAAAVLCQYSTSTAV